MSQRQGKTTEWRSSHSVSMGRRLAYMVGAVVMAAGVAMVPAAAVSAVYSEWDESLWLLVSAGITVSAGYIAWRIIGRQGVVTTKEGFATVGLAWFALAFFGTLPYLLTGSIGNLTDAFFETASGFTTTGASILPDPAILSHGMLFGGH